MSAKTIPGRARFTCFLVVTAVTLFLPIAITEDVPLTPVYFEPLNITFPPPQMYFDIIGAGQVSHLERVQDGHTSSSQIRCYCNLRQCMSSFSSVPVCYTSQGCFTQVTTSFSNFPGPSLLAIANITTTQSGKFNERLDVSNDQHSYGCQELLPTTQLCSKSFNLTEYSTFPTLPSVNSSKIVLTYHCCQDDLCNIRIDSIIITKRDVHEAQKSEFQSLSHQHKALVNDENMKMKDMIDYPTFTKRFDSIFSDEFGKVVADDNEKTSMDNKKNTDDFLKFMKLFDYVVSIDFKKSASSDNEKTPARNKRSINAEKEIMKWFDVYGFVTPSDYKITAPNDTVKNPVNNKENVTIVRNKKSISAVNDYVTPSDFKTTAPNDTTNIPINNQENFTIGEILKFMKSLNFTITDDSEMTAFTNTKVTQTNDKESITMGEIIEFLKWFSPVISVDSNKTADADTAQTLVRNKKSISAVNDYVTPSDFKTTAPNDTTNIPINNQENFTIGEILKFMKSLNFTITDDSEMTAFTNTKVTQTNDKESITMGEIIEFLKWFSPVISVDSNKTADADTAQTLVRNKKSISAVNDYVTPSDFKTTAPNDTTNIPINNQENFTIGEILKFMKSLNFTITDDSEMTAFTNTKVTQTNDKESITMGEIIEFLKWFSPVISVDSNKTADADTAQTLVRNKKSISAVNDYVTPSDFKTTAPNDTTNIPINNQENFTIGEILKFMKSLNFTITDDSEMTAFTNTKVTQTNDKESITMGEIIEFLKWFSPVISVDSNKTADADTAQTLVRNKKSISAVNDYVTPSDFKTTAPNDTTNIPINNQENFTIGEILKFMKSLNFTITDDSEMTAFTNTKVTQTNDKESITMGEIIEFLKWFSPIISVDSNKTADADTAQTLVRNKKSISAVNDYVTPSDFKTTAPNDTTNIPINNQENFTIGEILKFMKSLNFTITDDSEMTAFTNTKVTQTNDKESITMGEIIEFLKWFSPVISVDSNKTADADTAQTLVRNKKSISAVNDYVTPSDFKITAPNDTTSKPINNRENVTIGKILKFMKWFEPAISVEFDKIVAADTAKTTTNKKKIVDGILKIMKSFNFTVSDYFENITFANTEETHTNEKENIAIGEVLKFMKLFDYGVSIGFKASADTSKTPTRNKRSTGMVDTHKFKNNALILPGFVEMTATSDDITKIKKNKNKDINSILLSLFPIITNDFKKTALTNTAKIPIINKKINDTANVLQVKKWLESIVSDDFEKAVPTNTANTMTNNKKNSNVGDILKVMKWLDIAMSSDFRKIASVDNANLPMNNKKTSDMIDVPKVIKWFESVIPGDSEKIALADHLKTPNTMELPSTTVKGELSQYKSIFVAPEEFPTSSVYTPIYYMKPDFPAADFQMMVKIIKSMIPEVKGFPGRIIINRHLHEERKERARTNANVGRATAF